MSRDFHHRPYDEGTLEKLALFGAYLDEWIPVFVSSPTAPIKVVNIYDFFAGPGTDSEGRPGSPALILRALLPYADVIRRNGITVNVFLNETARWKVARLQHHVEHCYPPDMPVRINYSRHLFADALRAHRPSMEGAANLLFLDQSGMKQITEPVFRELASIPATDFMFFISSSFIGRFADHPNFRHHGNYSKEQIEALPYSEIHRAVARYYRSLVPPDTRYYIGQFSIKKGCNIYGLIFGSGHPYGLEKFLRTAWRRDPNRGEANYDIDREGLDPSQPDLPGMLKPKKLDAFERALAEEVLTGAVSTDADAYLFTLQEGCLPEHARLVLRALIDEGRIKPFQPRVSRTGWRNPRQIERV